MKLPKFESFQPVETQLAASRMNQICTEIAANEVKQGFGIRVTRNPGGTTVALKSRRDPVPQPPPFFPYLQINGTAANPTYQVSVERGTVIGLVPSPGASPENRDYWEIANMIDADGIPTLFDITVGQALYCVVSMTTTGAIASAAPPFLGVYAEGAPPSGTFGSQDTVYSFKLCTLESATVGGFETVQLMRYWAGNNIDLCGRNLDHRIFKVHIVEGIFYEAGSDYLCYRFGDYIGKFSSTATRPPHIGTLDTISSTYITNFT
jgi:hypothetical protein